MGKGLWRGVSAAALVALLGAGPGWAARTGGLATTVEPGRFALSSGLGYVERDMEDGVDVEARSRQLDLRAQFGLIDKLDLYLLLGFADADLNGASFKGALGGHFGIGAHYAMLEFAENDTKLMLDVQADFYRSSDGGDRVTQQGYYLATYLLREFGAAGRTGYFYPFGGVRVSYTYMDGKGTDNLTGKDFVGVFGGADYFVNPNVFFTGEVHVFDETSLYLGVGYRF